VVQGTAEDLLHYSRGDLSGNHRDGGGWGWSDVIEARKWSSGRECGVRGESYRFHLRELRNDLSRSGIEGSRSLIPQGGDGGEEWVKVFVPCNGSEDGFEHHTRLLYKHAKKSFAVFKAAKVAGVSDEEVGRLLRPQREIGELEEGGRPGQVPSPPG